jgi:SnoaL-like domain
VGTAGDRLALERVTWRGDGAHGGGPWRAALREGAARVDAAVAAVIIECSQGFNDRDEERIRAVLAEDLVFDDHRLAGVGRLKGVDAYIASQEAMWQLAPDARSDLLAFFVGPHGVIAAGRSHGTGLEGGALERLILNLWIVAGGRIQRFEMLEVDQVDAALARFEELRSDPLRIRIPVALETRAKVRSSSHLRAPSRGDADLRQATRPQTEVRMDFAAGADFASELARLALLESSSDPITFERLDRIGIAPGWRCLAAARITRAPRAGRGRHRRCGHRPSRRQPHLGLPPAVGGSRARAAPEGRLARRARPRGVRARARRPVVPVGVTAPLRGARSAPAALRPGQRIIFVMRSWPWRRRTRQNERLWRPSSRLTAVHRAEQVEAADTRLLRLTPTLRRGY